MSSKPFIIRLKWAPALNIALRPQSLELIWSGQFRAHTSAWVGQPLQIGENKHIIPLWWPLDKIEQLLLISEMNIVAKDRKSFLLKLKNILECHDEDLRILKKFKN